MSQFPQSEKYWETGMLCWNVDRQTNRHAQTCSSQTNCSSRTNLKKKKKSKTKHRSRQNIRYAWYTKVNSSWPGELSLITWFWLYRMLFYDVSESNFQECSFWSKANRKCWGFLLLTTALNVKAKAHDCLRHFAAYVHKEIFHQICKFQELACLLT